MVVVVVEGGESGGVSERGGLVVVVVHDGSLVGGGEKGSGGFMVVMGVWWWWWRWWWWWWRWRNLDVEARMDLGVVRVFGLVKKIGKERRCGVEIGRETAAFFSDLDFRFLLMHLHALCQISFFSFFCFAFTFSFLSSLFSPLRFFRLVSLQGERRLSLEEEASELGNAPDSLLYY